MNESINKVPKPPNSDASLSQTRIGQDRKNIFLFALKFAV